MFKMILALTTALLFAGCSTPEKKEVSQSAFVAGRNIPRSAMLTVRDSEVIRVYKTGRRIDAANPNIMHEAGEMYVIRRSPTWNTRPNTPVSSPAFKNRLQVNNNKAINIQLENMKKQQALLSDTNQAMKKLGTQMLNSRKDLQKIKTANKDKKEVQPLIDKLKKDQQKIVRKLAELETTN